MITAKLHDPIHAGIHSGIIEGATGAAPAPPTATSTPLTVDLAGGTRQVTFNSQTGDIYVRWGATAPAANNRIHIANAAALTVGCPVGTTQMTVTAVGADVVLDYSESATQFDYIKPQAILGHATSNANFVWASDLPVNLGGAVGAIGALTYLPNSDASMLPIAVAGKYTVGSSPGPNGDIHMTIASLWNNDYRGQIKNSTQNNDDWATTVPYPTVDSVMYFSDSATDRAIRSSALGATNLFTGDATGDFPDDTAGFWINRNTHSGNLDFSDGRYTVYVWLFNADRGEMGVTVVDNAETDYPGKAFSGFDCICCIAWDEDIGLVDLTGRGAVVNDEGTVSTATQASKSELSGMVNPNVVASDQSVEVPYDATGTLTTLPTHESLFFVYCPDAIDTALEWYDSTDTLIPTNGTLTIAAGTTVRVFAPFHAAKVKLKSTSTGTAYFNAIIS